MPFRTDHQSAPITHEMVLLHDETARSFGYPNYLTYKTAEKMAQAPETVTNFLHKLRQELTPSAERNTHHLLVLKIEDHKTHKHSTDNVKTFLRDDGYYSHILDKKQSAHSTLFRIPRIIPQAGQAAQFI
ncbi:hypothetical protein PT974_01893 [Cladobotryum mycophilum]|uniref:Peptidase M3A/M3B catalytic domain-containing protein n=1 Tax=Cladobotryum mycophilum TaxID=491253 RepID=A0ABR0SXD4_9HYPO